MKYVQFKVLSTGYPTFEEKDKVQIDMLGSWGRSKLDGRVKNINDLIRQVIGIYKKHDSKNSIVGFEILSCHKDNYVSGHYHKVLYTCTNINEITL